MKKLMEVKEVLENLQINVAQQKGTKEKEKIHEEKDTLQTSTIVRNNFQINQGIIQVDKDTTQKPLKDIEQLDLVLSKIPTKALYKLQIIITNGSQSRARIDAMNLETNREVKEVLEISLKEVHPERDEEKQHMEKMEQRLEEVFQTITDDTLAKELST
jgi:hypothetical protein